MKKLAIFYFFLVFFCINGISQENLTTLFKTNGEVYFKFNIGNSEDVPKITRIASIDNVLGQTIYAYANEKEFNAFLKTGLDYTILPHPNEGFDPPMADFDQIKNSKAWDFYPTYDAYVAMMYQFEADYPGLCDVFSIGQTVNGRDLLVAKISDNINQDENEPEFFYTSTMHGDETAGYIFMLRLIDTLLSSYGSAARITNLVNEIEIYINPLANPDGTYYGGNNTVASARRYNANNVDLNRNFPDVVDGLNPNTQPETYAFMAFAESRHFVMSANLHGGEEVCNYPWDHKFDLAADDLWWQYVCHEYADTVHAHAPSSYMDEFDNGITNGAAWYVIDGGRQDYMNYFHQCREFTLELSDTKLLQAYNLPIYWGYNYRSLLNYMEQGLFGIRGIVTDALTGLPIEAEVFILNHEIIGDSSWMYSDLPVGNYHRPVYAGTYDIRFSAPCHEDVVIYNVSVVNRVTTILDVQLTPVSNTADFTVNDTTVLMDENVFFTDLSCGDVLSWQWTVTGPGTPVFAEGTNSNSQDPVIQFPELGLYDVSLTITTSTGTYTENKLDFIMVTEGFLMANGSFTTCFGSFYDSGGSGGNYSNNQNFESTFFPSTINSKLKADFVSFNLEYQSSCNYDYLQIFDGPDSFSTEIGKYCGTNSPGMIVSTHETGALTFVFHSDVSVTLSGWLARLTCESEVAELDLSVLLEGPFNGFDMNTHLNDLSLIPLDQPFGAQPWNYFGSESVASSPNPDVVDWILVELRDAPDAISAVPASMIAQQAAFLLKDGSVVDLDGFSTLPFNIELNQQLFVVLWHRNHLGVMSALPLTEAGGVYSYDFSTGAGQAYGTDAQKNLGGGNYGMYSGDANADGILDENDGVELWYLETGQSGYLGSDVDLNSQSDNQDKNDFWYVNKGKYTQVPE